MHSVKSKSSNIKQEIEEELDELDRFSMEFDKPVQRRSIDNKINCIQTKFPKKRNTTDHGGLPSSYRPVLMAAQNLFK